MDADLIEAWNLSIWAAREIELAKAKWAGGKDATANLTEAKKHTEAVLAIISSKLSSHNSQL